MIKNSEVGISSGIAIGAAGTDIAREVAHIALRRVSIVKMNLAFTAVYDVAGLLSAVFCHLFLLLHHPCQ